MTARSRALRPGTSQIDRDDDHGHRNDDPQVGSSGTRHHLPAVTAICAVCGRDTHWMRTDARYCSGACRQRAYRQRRAVAS
jgi:hypothetical protein